MPTPSAPPKTESTVMSIPTIGNAIRTATTTRMLRRILASAKRTLISTCVKAMMGRLLTFQRPAADQKKQERGEREQLAIHSADADPHGSFRIAGTCRREPAAQTACDLPCDDKRKHNDHELPQDHAVLQVVQPIRQQATDFGLDFHRFPQ